MSRANPPVIYAMEVADRPGIVHSIAAVFAHRGLSIEGLMADTGRAPTRVLVVFSGTPRQQKLVEQVLMRLHHVHGVRVLTPDAPELRAIAICRVLGALPELAGVVVQLHDGTALLSGRYAAVDAALERLVAAALISEVSRTLVAL